MQRRDLGDAEAAEELQVDDVGELGLDLGELVERGADLREQSSGSAMLSAVWVSSEVMSSPPPRFCAEPARARSITTPRIARAA